jgi:hypothetical protein
MPMDIEWAEDGETGELMIVQARPETVESRVRTAGVNETYRLAVPRREAADHRACDRRPHRRRQDPHRRFTRIRCTRWSPATSWSPT